MSPRGLDHIVHAVRDLHAEADFYQRAGFAVGAHNKHSWGTHNRIVQFPGVFIELINVGQPELIQPHSPSSFSFGAFTRDFLAREEGLSMLVLEVRALLMMLKRSVSRASAISRCSTSSGRPSGRMDRQ